MNFGALGSLIGATLYEAVDMTGKTMFESRGGVIVAARVVDVGVGVLMVMLVAISEDVIASSSDGNWADASVNHGVVLHGQ